MNDYMEKYYLESEEFQNNENICFYDTHESLTLHSLKERIQKFISIFKSKQIHPGDIVGVIGQPCLNLPPLIMALFSQKIIYLPIDSAYPFNRIRKIILQSNPKLVITLDHKNDKNIEGDINGIECINIDTDTLTNIEKSSNNIALSDVFTPQENKTAYIIYTSGSTGKPKGVLVSYTSLINQLSWLSETFNFLHSDKIIIKTSISFDVSLEEILLPLYVGITGVIYPTKSLFDPEMFIKFLTSNKITILDTTPTYLLNLMKFDNLFPNNTFLRCVIVGGESLTKETVREWTFRSQIPLYNLYGLTETSITCTYYKVGTSEYENSCQTIPIGKSIKNSSVLLFDESGKVVSSTEIGEICVSGACLSQGYINDSYYLIQSNNFYKTGDLGKLLPDGNIEFIGRKDRQIKIRGYRVELSELETCLKKRDDILFCLAALSEEKKLICYVLPKEKSSNLQLYINNIYDYLSLHLPQYMLPHYIILLSELPFNVNGKLDPEKLNSDTVALRFIYKQTDLRDISELEGNVLAIWEEVLKIKNISIDDNFFNIGGDSLTLTTMALGLQEKLDIKLDFSQFINNPTVKTIIDGKRVKGAQLVNPLPDMDLRNAIRNFPLKKQSSINNEVLITGATGFLGINILFDLIHKTDSILHIIIRSDNNINSCERLFERYKYYFNVDSLDLKRIKIYNGNVANPLLGLDKNQYDLLSTQVNTVIHCAAQVNHVIDYSSLRETNVLGTKNILDFVSNNRPKNLHVMSTTFMELSEIEESFLSDECLNFKSGYELTKYVSEILLSHANNLGYPINIYRLPIVVGRLDNKMCNWDWNHFTVFLNKCIESSSYPNVNIKLYVIPVDVVSHFIISRMTYSESTVYNMVYHDLYLSDVFHALSLITKTKLKELNFEDWLSNMSLLNKNDPFYKLLPLYLYNDINLDSQTIKNCKFLTALNEGNTSLHLTKQDLINLCINQLKLKGVTTDEFMDSTKY